MDTALATPTAAPPLAGLHHVGITVTDLARSVAWYGEMLGMVPVMEEHHPGGRTVVLVRPGTTVDVGLDEHTANEGETFACHRTGLDHLSLSVASRAELDLARLADRPRCALQRDPRNHRTRLVCVVHLHRP